MPALAQELSPAQGVRALDLEIRLRRQFALARLAETVAGVVGWEAVVADVEGVFRIAKLVQESSVLPAFFEQLAAVAELEDFDVGANAALADYLVVGQASPDVVAV